jgi:HD superfamily phosphohydrolase
MDEVRTNPKNGKNKPHIIYDVLYGFIQLTQVEWEIIHSPFYQRLRWIKQLGFSCYTFHGAEHSRFGHSIGVLYNAHCILKSIHKAVDDAALFSGDLSSPDTLYHQNIRLAALLHDLGTFPFSHTTENSYIRYGQTSHKDPDRKDDHEHLGSFIIKRTNYPGGVTHILNSHGIEVQKISNLVKGLDENVLANQILHSEIDCDRMDYLLRDAHYTGLQYGNYDRDYLLHHFTKVNIAGNEILAINEKAIYCIEDFLLSRFSWYSQVVRSARGAKFDAIAEQICFFLLKENLIYRYSDLLEIIEKDPMRFYSFNDSYFMNLLYNLLEDKKLAKNKNIENMAKDLLLQKSPVTIKHEVFKQRILSQDNKSEYDKVMKKARSFYQELESFIAKNGEAGDWIIDDLPRKNIIFLKSHKKLVEDKTQVNLLLERDPTKIYLEDGNVRLLSNFEQSVIGRMQNQLNFIPHVYCSESSYDLLKAGKIL